MKNEPQTNPQGRLPLPVPFYYGWVIVAITFIATLNGAGIRSAAQVFIKPLEAEFGWSRAAIASAVAVSLFLFGVAAPISGWLLDRFGQRRVMTGCLALLVVGVAGTTVMEELWHFIILWGVIVGLGAGGMSSVLAATVAQRWFMARRGLTLGILNSASSTGQLIFIPFLMAMIVSAGWRAGSLVMIVISGALIIIIGLFMRDDPSELGLEPYGSGERSVLAGGQMASLRGSSGPPASVRLHDVLRSSTFWLLCGSFFVCGGTSNGLIGTHLIPYAIDRGIPEVTAAATVGVMGGMNFVGTMTSGYLTDRVDRRKLLAWVFVLRGVALFILPYVSDFSGLMIFAVIYGLDWFATVPPIVTMTGDAFGKQAIGKIYGWIFLSHQIGGALSAIGAGAIFVWYGDYLLAFLIGGAMTFVAAAMGLMIRPGRPELPPTAEARKTATA
ncbi:MAG: MFS transporter [Candidatus Binatia bacterium]